jgi:hypothetical protein
MVQYVTHGLAGMQGRRVLTALSAQHRADLLDMLDDRVNTGSTLIASQLSVDAWHAYLGEPTLAGAILDREAGQELATGKSTTRPPIDLRLIGEIGVRHPMISALMRLDQPHG